ncbi:MAG: hypothetical protein JWO42_3890, partial [Chloroflexi bacterium]|nr:hypothetical protein [Chloroflexota bacterium]
MDALTTAARQCGTRIAVWLGGTRYGASVVLAGTLALAGGASAYLGQGHEASEPAEHSSDQSGYTCSYLSHPGKTPTLTLVYAYGCSQLHPKEMPADANAAGH